MQKTMIAAAFGTLGLLPAAAAATGTHDTFFGQLSALCGKSYEGRVTTTDPADADFAASRLVMHVRDCSADEIRIPFHVGENRSRTWVISRTENGLRLKHDHRHEDGGEDKVTQYGGDTATAGTPSRQEFPVDAFSQAMFTREQMTVSNANVWAVEVELGTAYTYELSRPNRLLRVTFDLTREVPSPPPAWGSER